MKIVVVVSYLLLFDSFKIFKSLGIRYRVVVGILEVFDVFIVIVFEEIGDILVIFDGKLWWDILNEIFEELFVEYWFGICF